MIEKRKKNNNNKCCYIIIIIIYVEKKENKNWFIVLVDLICIYCGKNVIYKVKKKRNT